MRFFIWAFLALMHIISNTSAQDSGWSLVGSPIAFAHPCTGADDISSMFEPELPPEQENSYNVNIMKKFPRYTKIKLTFDADAIVTLNDKSFARISASTIYDNAFEIRFFRSHDGIGFKVQGKTTGVFPYFKSLNINNVEYCNDPLVGYLDRHIEGFQSRAETPNKDPPGNCGRRKVTHTELIVNGAETKPGDWPWHVALYRLLHSEIKYICGGTLISNYFVLTAAHCASHQGVAVVPEILSVILGKYNLIGGDVEIQEREVYQVILHDLFEYRRLNNDIALLKLKTEVIFTDYIQPACLWYTKAKDKLPSNEIIGTIVGWGFDSTSRLSKQLKQTSVPIVSESTCLKSNPVFFTNVLNKDKFCAGYNNGTSACNGDSGSAFQVFVPDKEKDVNQKAEGAWYVKGIVSLAIARTDSPVCDPDQYVVFTDVEKFLNWIELYVKL